MATQPVYLIDGSAYVHRAFHAMGDLATSDGQPTGALLGVTQLLLRFIKQSAATHMVFILDASGKTFRHELYPAYKANRKARPEELSRQLPHVLDLVAALGIPIMCRNGVEADDLIASVVHQLRCDMKLTIISADKDLMQLIDERVVMVDTMRGKRYAADDVIQRFGVPPRQLRDLLALMGDASDNVPGVPGIGPKTASALLQRFGDIDTLLCNLAQVEKVRTRGLLDAHRDALLLSRRLVTLKSDVDIPLDLDAYRIGSMKRDVLLSLFRRFEFDELITRYRLDSRDVPTPAPRQNREGVSTHLVLDLPTLDRVVKRIGGNALAMTFATDPNASGAGARLVGIALAPFPNEAWYIPLRHGGYLGAPRQLAEADVLSRLRPVIEGANPLQLTDLKDLHHLLSPWSITPMAVEMDISLAAYLLDPEATSQDLETLGAAYLDHRQIPAIPADVAATTHELAATIYATRAVALRELSIAMRQELKRLELDQLFCRIELPLSRILAGMEALGIAVNGPLLRDLSGRFAAVLRQLAQEIFELAGRKFNINSPSQLGEILFGSLKLPAQKRTRSGYSTDHAVLQELVHCHPIVAKVLSYRSVSKLKSTYADALVALQHPETGRVHTCFNQTVTATGRLSSSGPNLQNIPIRSAAGREIRHAFVAPSGKLLLSLDYSQIELRLLAHLSEDPAMCQAFHQEQDIHSATAAELFDVAQTEVTVSQRRAAKAINFGIIYGMGPRRLARDLEIEFADAKRFIDRYFLRYPKVRSTLKQIVEGAQRRGYVTTVLNRRRYLRDLNNQNRRLRTAAERAALNTPIQGSAADLIKLAMIRVDQAIRRDQIPAQLLLQVHDELVFEIDADASATVAEQFRAEMEQVMTLRVPLRVDVKTGSSWRFD